MPAPAAPVLALSGAPAGCDKFRRIRRREPPLQVGYHGIGYSEFRDRSACFDRRRAIPEKHREVAAMPHRLEPVVSIDNTNVRCETRVYQMHQAIVPEQPVKLIAGCNHEVVRLRSDRGRNVPDVPPVRQRTGVAIHPLIVGAAQGRVFAFAASVIGRGPAVVGGVFGGIDLRLPA